MKPPGPAKKPTPPRPEATVTQREPKGKDYPLSIRFHRQMKPQRVYPLVVEVARGPKGSPASGEARTTLVLRPVISGAHVVPVEQKLNASKPGERATFYVTPLARGRLSYARLEVVHQGQVVEKIHLTMRGTTQRLTWVLALLTFLIPWFLLYVTVWHPLTGTIPVAVPRPKVDSPGPPMPQPVPPQPAPGGAPPPPPLEMAPKDWDKGSPGDVLAYQIRKFVGSNVPDISYVTAFVASPRNRLKLESQRVDDDVAWAVGVVYDYACDLKEPENLSFWVAVVLAVATGLSWFSHRSWRTRLRTEVTLAAPVPAVQIADTVNINPTAEPPHAPPPS